jgi:hypothetical protein
LRTKRFSSSIASAASFKSCSVACRATLPKIGSVTAEAEATMIASRLISSCVMLAPGGGRGMIA